MTPFILLPTESVLYRSYKPTIILLSGEIAKLRILNLQGSFRVKTQCYVQAISHSLLMMVMLVNMQLVLPAENS